MKKGGIQGGKGSYHEAAARQMYGNVIELTYFETFKDLFDAARDCAIDKVLVAIANNRMGFIAEPYNELTASNPWLRITGETYLRVEHALLGLPGASLRDIREVHSQAPAIAQCMQYLSGILPDALIIEQHDTAGSAEIVAKSGDRTAAAIASLAAGELHGLEVIQANIQDDPANITRFVEVVTLNSASEVQDANKTTLLLKTPQVAGALVDALLPFKKQGINLCSLQSRLIPNSAFEMMFFVEFEAGLQEERTQKVLRELESKSYELIILGCYKSAPINLSTNMAA